MSDHASASPAGPSVAPVPGAGLLMATAWAVFLLTVIFALAPTSPNAAWDIDPRSEAAMAPAPMIGPILMAWLNVAAVGLLALALIACRRAGGRLHPLSLALAGLGAITALLHMPDHAENSQRLGAWIAAVAIGLATLHLGEHPRVRRLLIVGMIAMLLPMTVRAATYVFVDHPATVEAFYAAEAEILESRGWEAGSPQHDLYIRRLEASDAVGAFGLSNVHASILLALSALAGGMVVERLRDRRFAVAGLLALPMILGAMTLPLTGSRGAMGAAVLIAGLAMLVLIVMRLPPLRRLVLPMTLALVVLAAGAVAARGAMGPPDTVDGERSLLFRWHYWVGAAELWRQAPPLQQILGVGPTGFREGYLRTRPVLNPEEITSAHNVAVDYLIMLGVGGAAWVSLLILWLIRSARAAAGALAPDAPDAPDSPLPSDQPRGAAAQSTWLTPPDARRISRVGLLTLMLFFAWMFLTFPTLLGAAAFPGWGVSLVAFLALVALLTADGNLPAHTTRLGLLLAAAALMVHNQIEMTFFHDGSALFAWALMGLAGARTPNAARAVEVATDPASRSASEDAPWRALNAAMRGRRPDPPHRPTDAGRGPHGGDDARPRPSLAGAAIAASLVGVVLGMLVVHHAMPITRQQRAMLDAAHALQAGDARAALDGLSQAMAIIPRDHRPAFARVRLLMEGAQWAARANHPDVVRRYAAEALATLDALRLAGVDTAAVARSRARVHEQAADLLDAPAHHSLALSAWTQAIERSPHNVNDHLARADLLWRMGRHAEAAHAYREALALSDKKYLDPARQLGPDDLTRAAHRASLPQTDAP